MKTKFLLFFAFVMLFAIGVKAQQIFVGSTKLFSATNGSAANTNLWTVSGASTAYSIATPDGVTTNITWKTPGNYTVTYKETNPNSGICEVTKTLDVSVVGNTLTMGTAPISECAGTSGNSPKSFVVNRTNGVNAINIGYEYKINGGTATTGNVTLAANATSATIALSLPNPTDGHTDNVVILTITSAADTDGNTVSVVGLNQTVTLYATPIVDSITFN